MSFSLPNTRPHSYAVIMAGGSGTRLWPLSRKSSPKQFHNFVSESGETLIEETASRLRQVVSDKSHLFVSTGEAYRDRIREIFPDLPENRLILEPVARGTAAALALISAIITHEDPEAIIATIPSDHVIGNPEEFAATLLSAFDTAEKFPEKMVTIGINPTAPDTGLGYIQMGEEIATIGNHRVFSIAMFAEKPDRETAEEYLKNWEYLWNAGYFIFSGKTFLSWVKRYTPLLAKAIDSIAHEHDFPHNETLALERLRSAFEPLPTEPVEPAIIEKLSPAERAVIPSPLEWNDIGNWSALFDLLKNRHDTHTIAQGNHIDVGSEHCFVLSNDKLIATIGLQDTIIVETQDALLVANKNRVDDIKKLLEKLREEKGDQYL